MASPTTAAAPAPETSAVDADGAWVVERQRVRRPLGALYCVATLILPLGLTAGVAMSQAPFLERSLHSDAMKALNRAGIPHVHVLVDGRQLVAKVPTGTPEKRVESTLLDVPGVEAVETVSVYASKAEARACTALQTKIDRATNREKIPFLGGSTHLS